MAYSDDDREKLKKLSVDDLIAMLEAKDEATQKNEQKFEKERKQIIKQFLRGGDDKDADEPADDWRSSDAFKRLKKIIF